MRTVSKLFFISLFFLLAVCVFAQAQDSVALKDSTARTDSVQAKKTKVYLLHANTLSFDKNVNPDAQILVGDVSFRHDSSYMYCDSAYFFELTNSLEAFGSVRMEQGDTLFVYGDYLFYNGNTQMA